MMLSKKLFIAILTTYFIHGQCSFFRKLKVEDNSGINTNGIKGGISPAVIKGYKIFNEASGENILVKGVDYYPRPNKGVLNVNSVDYFTEEHRHIWERDISQFKALGINAIRLYAVDPAQDHSAFMCALNKARIYVMVELASACPTCAVTRDEAPKCYPNELKTRGEKVIREFSKYTNTLAFSAGNEVNHFVPLGKPPQWNAPCLKKFIRDMRAFARHCESAQMRHVPIGLIMADSDRDINTLYYNCQSDPNDELEHAEWYGINTYVACNGAATKIQDSVGFTSLKESFEKYKYSIPVLLTEFGCLSSTFPLIDGYEAQRTFNQASWMDLPQIQDVFAGGFAFEYSIESAIAQTPFPFKEFGQANYGIGYFSPKDCDDVKVMCEYNRTPAFYNLKKAYAHDQHNQTVTLNNFVPKESRTGRTKCPAQFPPLHSFEWSVDSVVSISCPLARDSEWTCPPHESSIITSLSSFLIMAILVGFTSALIGTLTNFKGIATRNLRPFPLCNWKRQESSKEENDPLVARNEVESAYKAVE